MSIPRNVTRVDASWILLKKHIAYMEDLDADSLIEIGNLVKTFQERVDDFAKIALRQHKKILRRRMTNVPSMLDGIGVRQRQLN